MPNLFSQVIESKLVGKILTLLSLLALLSACVSALFMNVVEARTHEDHRNDTDVHMPYSVKAKMFVTRAEWVQSVADREKRFQTEASAIRESIQDIKALQTEQRQLSLEMLKELRK